jgi:hypothetical protein
MVSITFGIGQRAARFQESLHPAALKSFHGLCAGKTMTRQASQGRAKIAVLAVPALKKLL